VLTGQFTDSPVKGLQYRTASHSGETDANGGFKYLQGEMVTFFVGDISLGEVVGASRITPFDLAGISPPTVVPSSGPNKLAFDHAVNLAVFFQTLDADGDPSNGIEIPVEIRALVKGLTINFKARWESNSTLELRRLVGAGRTANLWGGVRAIRTNTNAIKSMYATLGLSPPVMYMASSLETVNANTGVLTSRQTEYYDVNGRLSQMLNEYDANGDGVLEKSITSIAYDLNGDPTSIEDDTNGNGVVDHWTFNTFDVNGNETRSLNEYDTNDDGVVDSRTTLVSTYDAKGYPFRVLIESDTNADGTVDIRSTQTYTFDANGRLTRAETDQNGDGKVVSWRTLTFDGNGNSTLEEEDANGDGKVDARYTSTYDSNGKLIGSVYEYDSNGDGVIDSWTKSANTYDTNGLVKWVLTEMDTNGDGLLDKRRTDVFDANGRRAKTEYDNNADGVVDRRITYTRDVNGYLTLTEEDTNADGAIDLRTTFLYVKVSG
jgi:hypothetical protein